MPLQCSIFVFEISADPFTGLEILSDDCKEA